MREAVESCDVPEGSLLAARVAEAPGSHGDCYAVPAAREVDLSAFIAAFYTTPIFRAERLVLRLGGIRSSDADVRALAAGQADGFAAWRVAGRRADEILLTDRSGRTSSWLAVAPEGSGTRLRFGSAVMAVPGRGGQPTLGPVFQSLMGAHGVYSRLLLGAAAARLQAG